MTVIDSNISIFERCSPSANPFGDDSDEEEIEDLVMDTTVSTVVMDIE